MFVGSFTGRESEVACLKSFCKIIIAFFDLFISLSLYVIISLRSTQQVMKELGIDERVWSVEGMGGCIFFLASDEFFGIPHDVDL